MSTFIGEPVIYNNPARHPSRPQFIDMLVPLSSPPPSPRGSSPPAYERCERKGSYDRRRCSQHRQPSGSSPIMTSHYHTSPTPSRSGSMHSSAGCSTTQTITPTSPVNTVWSERQRVKKLSESHYTPEELECMQHGHQVSRKYGILGIIAGVVLFPAGLIATRLDSKLVCKRCKSPMTASDKREKKDKRHSEKY